MSRTGVAVSVLLLLSFTLYLVIGYFTVRTNFNQLLFCYSLLFVLYFFIYRLSFKKKWTIYLALAGLLFRAAQLFHAPNLSDDFFRFIWDGQLTCQGINPYQFLPSEILHNHPAPMNVWIYQHLNSANFYSVYPPASQLIFFVSALCSTSILGNVLVMKSFILAFEAGSVFLLWKMAKEFRPNKNVILLYALNPLVIIELTGNIHFEAGMIFFTLLAIWMVQRGNVFFSSASISVAVMMKLLPLFFIPFLCRQLKSKQLLRFIIYIMLFLIFFSFPLWNIQLLKNFSQSIQLYFNYFAFNGSIFYLARYIDEQAGNVGWVRMFGAVVPFLFVGIIAVLWMRLKRKSFRPFIFEGLTLILTFYLILATTVHPWYLTPIIAFSVFTNFRYPIVWSSLIPFTYLTYQRLPYEENLWVILAEYSVVFGFFLYELTRKAMVNLSPDRMLNLPATDPSQAPSSRPGNH